MEKINNFFSFKIEQFDYFFLSNSRVLYETLESVKT